jgi:two-component system, cell cycle sensor histidine kinase and response regulator CckA
LGPSYLFFPGLVLLIGILLVAFMLIFALANGLSFVDRSESGARPAGMPVRARQVAFTLIEQSPIPCVLTGYEGNGLFMNEAFRDLFNISERGTVTLEQVFAGNEEVMAILYRLTRAANGGLAADEDVQLLGAQLDVLRRRTGGNRWLRFQIRPADLRNTHFLWEVTDITDVKTLSNAAEARGQINERLLDELPQGVLALNSKGRILFANRQCRAWFGYKGSEFEKGDIYLTEFTSQSSAVYALSSGQTIDNIEVTDRTGSKHSFRLTRGFSDPTNMLEGKWAGGSVFLVSPYVAQKPEEASSLPLEEAEVELVTPGGRVAEHAGENDQSNNQRREVGRKLTDVIDAAPIGMAVIDEHGTILRSNKALADLTTATLLPGDRFVHGIARDDREAVDAFILALRESKEVEAYIEVHLAGKQGRSGQLFGSRVANIDFNGKALTAVILYYVDATDQRQLEVQFAQSQKMQAVGQLAGGVAHDFNNVLTAIIGHCDLLFSQHKVGDPSFADIDQIKQNANRAANLVRQLLAFSRKQTLMPKIVQLPDAVAETNNLLDRLLGEKIELSINHQRDLGLVKVDQGQLEQVIVNLAVNARDAMKEGGTLRINTYNVDEDESVALGHTLMPKAKYVCMEISDTGTGIAKEDMGQIFEPFFTTKKTGEGTGLGLSTVYGIVKQTGGFIFPESELGEGTTFRIYFPRHAQEELQVQAAEQEKAEPTDLSGAGTILLVEDEDAVRAFASRALSTRGYNVVEAENGEIALDRVEELEGKIDLMVSDVVMPNMDGPTMAKAVREKYPNIKVIFISGYTEDAFEDELDRPEDFVFLPKPFSLKQLASKVKEVLKDD